MKSWRHVRSYLSAAALFIAKAPLLIIVAAASLISALVSLLTRKPPRTYDPDEYEV